MCYVYLLKIATSKLVMYIMDDGGWRASQAWREAHEARER